ncbi:aminoglycoside phosphotransferase family protein [Pelagibius sp.]|uniref:aminoglycoside phosphotransferase family protein n=1 Tax=Pelagibius sp. TaxID=1931238 RepID=UPI003B509D50
MSDSREELCRRFLAAAGWDSAERRLLAADASFRSYDRLSRGGETAVLMNAPPPQENVQVFRNIADLLLDIELSAPRPLAMDREAGFLLLEDFGDRTFTRALAEGADEGDLYRLAVDTLIALHQRWYNSDMTGLPSYDEQRLLDEAALLVDWYLPAVTGRETPPALRESYLEAWRAAVPVMLAVPQSLVLRDYHVDNLMILEGREGIARCGLLDFQDAVIGPVSYDLVSLLEDARRDVAPDLAAEMLARYRDAFRHTDPWAFAASYAALGAQRNAKIIGIFTRLCRRDGKAHYLKHIPRVWRLLEGDLQHPALTELAEWFAREIPPELRVTPQENQ